ATTTTRRCTAVAASTVSTCAATTATASLATALVPSATRTWRWRRRRLTGEDPALSAAEHAIPAAHPASGLLPLVCVHRAVRPADVRRRPDSVRIGAGLEALVTCPSA